jgi:hypothetical protein
MLSGVYRPSRFKTHSISVQRFTDIWNDGGQPVRSSSLHGPYDAQIVPSSNVMARNVEGKWGFDLVDVYMSGSIEVSDRFNADGKTFEVESKNDFGVQGGATVVTAREVK